MVNDQELTKFWEIMLAAFSGWLLGLITLLLKSRFDSYNHNRHTNKIASRFEDECKSLVSDYRNTEYDNYIEYKESNSLTSDDNSDAKIIKKYIFDKVLNQFQKERKRIKIALKLFAEYQDDFLIVLSYYKWERIIRLKYDVERLLEKSRDVQERINANPNLEFDDRKFRQKIEKWMEDKKEVHNRWDFQ